MGKRGFIGQPAEVAKAKGLYRPSRHGSLEDQIKSEFLSAVPEPPESLGTHGAEFWHDMLTQLLKVKGLVAIIDLANFELMAYNFQVIRECQEKLKLGKMLIDDNGNMKPSPYIALLQSSEKTFIALSREFGCTPAARNKLTVPKEDSKEESLSDFKI